MTTRKHYTATFYWRDGDTTESRTSPPLSSNVEARRWIRNEVQRDAAESRDGYIDEIDTMEDAVLRTWPFTYLPNGKITCGQPY